MDCWGGSLENGTDPCSQHRSESATIWALFGTVWILTTFTLLNALRLVRRNKLKQQWFEPRILSMLLISSVNFTTLGYYKCIHPAKFAIGIDPVSTSLFAVGCTLLFGFLLFTPLNPSGTGITSFAMKRQRNMYKCYQRAFPLLVMCATAGSFLPFMGLMGDIRLLDQAVTATFAIFGGCVAIVVFVDIYAVQKLRRDFRHALKSKRHEVTDSQKRGIDTIVESTGKVDLVMALCCGMIVPTCLLVAIGLESAREACWVLIPVMLLLACGWVVRYALFSRQVSLRVYLRHAKNSELPTSTRGRPSLIGDKSDSLSSSQMMLQISSYSKRRGRRRSSPRSNSASAIFTESVMRKGSGSLTKNKRSFLPSIPARPLTRVDEVEYEGTIVSKAEPLEVIPHHTTSSENGDRGSA